MKVIFTARPELILYLYFLNKTNFKTIKLNEKKTELIKKILNI